MISVKTVALFAFPAMLVAVLWTVAVPEGDAMSNTIGRFTGVLALGIALLAIILVFRVTAAPTAIRPRRIGPIAPPSGEFRRGFAVAASSRRKQLVLRPGVVVRLHRSSFEQRAALRKEPPAIAAETIETLTQRLHDRAEKLWHRRAV